MSDDQFTKLFKYIQKMEQRMDEGFAKVAQDFDRIYSLLDSTIKKNETIEQEQLVMGHQLTVHEGWINQLANKTETKLTDRYNTG